MEELRELLNAFLKKEQKAQEKEPVRPKDWTDKDEQEFQNWYWIMSRLTEVNPNADDPMHFYNYREAFRAKALPEISPEDGKWHWPSTYKLVGHPNLIVDGMDTRTMTPAPKELDGQSLVRRLLIAKQSGAF